MRSTYWFSETFGGKDSGRMAPNWKRLAILLLLYRLLALAFEVCDLFVCCVMSCLQEDIFLPGLTPSRKQCVRTGGRPELSLIAKVFDRSTKCPLRKLRWTRFW